MKKEKKLTETQELLRILRSPLYTKKQKKIVGIKWKFNQMPVSYKQRKKQEYLKKIKEIENDSSFDAEASP